MARNIKKGAALAAGVAAVLAVGTTGGAVAGGLITGAQIKNQTITSADLGPNSVKYSEVADGAVSWPSLTKGAHNTIKSYAGKDGLNGADGVDGQDGVDGLPGAPGEKGDTGDTGATGATGAIGAQGPQGPRGEQGPKGDPGDPASDTLGGLAGDVQTATPTPIANIGGTFGKFTETVRATKLGEMTLQPGTYLISSSAFFDTVAADSPRTTGSHLELAVRVNDGTAWGKDYGTCFTSAFPAGDREATCATTRVVTVTSPETVQVLAFGYNDDTSSTGAGTFTAMTDVSAVKVG